MAKGTPVRLLLIVTGSTLRAEEVDRPLGYYLKQRIEQALSEAMANGRRDLGNYIVGSSPISVGSTTNRSKTYPRSP